MALKILYHKLGRLTVSIRFQLSCLLTFLCANNQPLLEEAILARYLLVHTFLVCSLEPLLVLAPSWNMFFLRTICKQNWYEFCVIVTQVMIIAM